MTKRAYSPDYYNAHKEECKARTRSWRLRNLEKVRKYHRDWNKAHPGVILEACRKYRRVHPGITYKYHKQWRLANPEERNIERALWYHKHRYGELGRKILWTLREEVLLFTFKGTDPELARLLSRSVAAIEVHRSLMRKETKQAQQRLKEVKRC